MIMPEEHRTPLDEPSALAEQARLRNQVDHVDASPAPGTPGALVTGVDVAYDDVRDLVVAAAVSLDMASLVTVEEATASGPVPFPYRPGLLAFRELPAVLEALRRLERRPDLVVCDGYGYAHPRRFGLASHLGVLTGLPTFGVAKTPFGFLQAPLEAERGAMAPLSDPASGEEVGTALRTRSGVKPVYVSVGHRVSLAAASAHTLALTPHYRQPETTRRADRLCGSALAGALRAD